MPQRIPPPKHVSVTAKIPISNETIPDWEIAVCPHQRPIKIIENAEQLDVDANLVKAIFRLLIELNKVEQRESR